LGDINDGTGSFYHGQRLKIKNNLIQDSGKYRVSFRYKIKHSDPNPAWKLNKTNPVWINAGYAGYKSGWNKKPGEFMYFQANINNTTDWKKVNFEFEVTGNEGADQPRFIIVWEDESVNTYRYAKTMSGNENDSWGALAKKVITDTSDKYNNYIAKNHSGTIYIDDIIFQIVEE